MISCHFWSNVKKGRNFEQGRLAYEAAQCGACHRFGDDGGSVGPDLTAISSRFSTTGYS